MDQRLLKAKVLSWSFASVGSCHTPDALVQGPCVLVYFPVGVHFSAWQRTHVNTRVRHLPHPGHKHIFVNLIIFSHHLGHLLSYPLYLKFSTLKNMFPRMYENGRNGNNGSEKAAQVTEA